MKLECRRSYKKTSILKISSININPITQFGNIFNIYKKTTKLKEYNRMNLSTIDLDGYPKNRIVLLKEYNEEGFIFYTNYKSNKSLSIYKRNKVCCSFFWDEIDIQIIIKGNINKIHNIKSDKYFNSRPLLNKISCCISKQSKYMKNNVNLYKKLINIKRNVINNNIILKRPKYWGGFIIKPCYFEFWEGQPSRLHTRFIYELEKSKKNKWKLYRIYP